MLQDTSRLYAIRQVRTGVVLYPLNNLERNECGTWSAKESNNKYYAPDYYEELIRRYNEDNSAIIFGSAFDFYKKAVKEMKDSGKLSEYKYEKVTNIQ